MTAQTKRARGPAQKAEQAKEEDKPVFIKVNDDDEFYELGALDDLTEGEKMDLELQVGPQMTGRMFAGGGFVALSLLGFLAYQKRNPKATWEMWKTFKVDYSPEGADEARPTPQPDSPKEDEPAQ